MGEIETQTLGLNQGSFLLNVLPQHLAQHCMQQMRGRVVCRRCSAPLRAHLGLYLLASVKRTRDQPAAMRDDLVRQITHIADLETPT